MSAGLQSAKDMSIVQGVNVAANLSDERFAMMSEQYEDEQTTLKSEMIALQAEIAEQEQQSENMKLFIKRVRKYEGLNGLTPYALRELVKAIYVEKSDKSSGKRKQKIRIQYDLVDFIPINELLQQERQRETVCPKSHRFKKFVLLPYDAPPEGRAGEG